MFHFSGFHADDAVEDSLEHFTRLFFLERKWIAEVTGNDRLLRSSTDHAGTEAHYKYCKRR
jgi:hypothetical protein